MKFWWQDVPHKQIPTFMGMGLLYEYQESCLANDTEDQWRAAREQLWAIKKGFTEPLS